MHFFGAHFSGVGGESPCITAASVSQLDSSVELRNQEGVEAAALLHACSPVSVEAAAVWQACSRESTLTTYWEHSAAESW